MNVVRLRREIDLGKSTAGMPGEHPAAAPPAGEIAAKDPTRRSSGGERVLRWCVVGVALALAVLLGAWLTK